MVKKYKVIKSFPHYDVGDILELDEFGEYDDFSSGDMIENTEYFSPYLFTTEDGVDIYKGDKFWVLKVPTSFFHIANADEGHLVHDDNWKYFSTKEAAQAHIDKNKEVVYQEGEWLYYSNRAIVGLQSIFRYAGKNQDGAWLTKEAYLINEYGKITEYTYDVPTFYRNNLANAFIKKATPEQIQDILTKVATHKGFKKGVRYVAAGGSSINLFSTTNHWEYWGATDGLVCGYGTGLIYSKGKWATILPEPVAVVPEYVKCVSWKGWSFIEGKVYKVIDGKIHSELDVSNFDTLVKHNFVPSTKEEYDAQFVTKEVTITLDGDVVSTSHWGNNVKIVYK